MAKDYPRSYRLADQIQRELSALIRTEMKDPRVSPLLTISAVDVSKDLSQAKIYITVMHAEQRQSSLAALGRASGFLRSQLASRMSLRSVPHLHFYYDESAERGQQVADLIARAIKSDAR